MKKTTLIVLMAALAIGACKKPKEGTTDYQVSTTDTPVIVNNADTSFYISGLTGIVLKQLGKNSFAFNAVHTDGIQRNVTLDISGTPANMKINMDKVDGYTPFTANATVDVLFSPAGTYPITLTATPDRGETKVYTVNLKVDSFTMAECNNIFRQYMHYEFSIKDANNNIVPVENQTGFFSYPFGSKSGKTYLRYVPMLHKNTAAESYMTSYNAGYSNPENFMRLDFNCDNGEINIPEQKIRAIRYVPQIDTVIFNVSGKGAVNVEAKTYSFTYTSDSASYTVEGKFNYN